MTLGEIGVGDVQCAAQIEHGQRGLERPVSAFGQDAPLAVAPGIGADRPAAIAPGQARAGLLRDLARLAQRFKRGGFVALRVSEPQASERQMQARVLALARRGAGGQLRAVTLHHGLRAASIVRPQPQAAQTKQRFQRVSAHRLRGKLGDQIHLGGTGFAQVGFQTVEQARKGRAGNGAGRRIGHCGKFREKEVCVG
ncbi:MAG: hypothetical protein FWG56_03290 [Desulfovibrionaceae bacterium]|nr:hypothetical protein [Desulfovibrionaceae bacterium]